MVHMVKIRLGPAALRRAAHRGEHASRCSIRALPTRAIATNAAIREHNVEFPGGVPPAPGPQRSNVLDRKEAIKNAKPFSDFLTDTFNRQHDYLRISITERCNLRCLYCMPEEGIPLSPNANMLTTPEIFYLSSLFVSQGVTKIRLTGGEPTVRRDIIPLMHRIGSLRPKGLRELALTTNGISLHRKLDAMVEAGLTGVNLSLDTLDPFQFQIMTRRKGFDAVMKSIDRILEMNKLGAGVKLKVNCVVMRGLNEREILPFVELGREQDIEVRFIEYMPFGGNKWSEGKMISFQEMLDVIRVKYPNLRHVPGHKNDTSKTFEVPGFVGKVGFITSMTNDFCGSCNRLRITSDGNLKVCLHGNAEVSLRDLLRQGNNGEPIDQEAFERIRQVEMDHHEGRISDETALGWGQRERDLLHMIGTAVKRKEEKHADLNELAKLDNRPMILIDKKIPSSIHPHESSSSRQPIVPSLPYTKPLGMSPAPFAHLYNVGMVASTSTRAFSTAFSTAAVFDPEGRLARDTFESQSTASSSREMRPLGVGSEGQVAGITLHEDVQQREMLEEVKLLVVSDEASLQSSLKTIRQKYTMESEIYDQYWQLVAEAKEAKEEDQVDLTAQAAVALSIVLDRMWRKGYGLSNENDVRLEHPAAMEKANELAERSWQQEEAQRASSLQKGDIRGLLNEIEAPVVDATAIEQLERKIENLQDQIAAAKAMDVPKATGAAKATDASNKTDNIQDTDLPPSNGKEACERLIKQHLGDVDIPRSTLQLLDIAARQILQAEIRFAELHISSTDLKTWNSFVQRMIRKVKSAMDKRENPPVGPALWKERKSLHRRIKKAQTAATSSVLAQRLEQQYVDLKKLRATLISYKKAAKAAAEAERLEQVRIRLAELQSKRQMLQSQLNAEDKRISEANKKMRAQEAEEKLRRAKSAVLDDILDEAMRKKTIAAGTPKTHDTPAVTATEYTDLNDSKMERTSRLLMRHTASPDRPLEDAKPISAPTLQSMGDLHLSIPTSGFVTIDGEFIASFEAAIPELQKQVFEMQQRLKSSYPRIDNLPYDVWNSENKKTLQTWLKILIIRWRTRFYKPGKETQVANEQVKPLLDQLVRDHDLSNEAADRMVTRWKEIFGRKGAMDGDAEGSLDWDELNAGGMGFLAQNDAAYDDAPTQSSVTRSSGIGHDRRPSTALPSLQSRLYSTSSRPSHSPDLNTPSTIPSDAKPTSASASTQPAPSLPHLTHTGSVHMVSVSAKAHTTRTAIAIGTILFSNPIPLSLIQSNSLKKGDVLGVSRIAGIMAAKKCPEIVPLCHPIPLTHVGVELRAFGAEEEFGGVGRMDHGGVAVEAKVQCTGPTGVEMEALTAVMGAALSVVDMCKAVDKEQCIQDVRVVLKEGGRSGIWRDAGWKSWQE